jgi:hypothetical protein
MITKIFNKDIPVTEKTIASIQKALGTADNLLDKRITFQEKATTLLDKI